MVKDVFSPHIKAIYQIPTESVEPSTSVALAIQQVFYNLQVSSNAVGK
jgi:hypothetical protein